MKMFTRVGIIGLLAFCSFIQNSNAQSIIDPTDPVITYNASSPPVAPPGGTIGKWVRTKRLSWNTDGWKAYVLNGVPFRIKFPASYNPTANDGKKYPALVFFHGLGEKGTIYDNEYSLANGGQQFNTVSNNGTFDGYIIVPQSEGGWGSNHFERVKTLLDYMITNNKVDPFAISVNGLSSGGGASWGMMIDYPTYVATCLPMSMTTLGVATTANIQKYKFTPVWHFQGGLDGNPHPSTTNEVANAIAALGGQFKNTVYPNLGHGTWDAAWAEPDFYPAVKRAYSANPWTLFGRTEFCPGDAINVTVGVVPGMAAYEWRRNGVLIPGATSNTINVTQLGVYSARVRRGTIWSDWSRIPVEIKIKQATVTPPVQTQGLMSRVIPALNGATTVTLQVPTGYASYEWRKVGSNNSIGNTNTLVASTPGQYIARVTEQYGCSSSFSDPFTVIDANGANKPSPASNLIATTTSKTTIKLDWSDNPSPQHNETNYEIYQGTSAGGPYSLVAITGADAITHEITGLTPKVKYFYKLRAVNNFAASAASNEASATTESDTQPPTAPGNLQVTGTTRTSVSLVWSGSTDDVAVVRYQVYINGVHSYNTTTTAITINELTSQQSYNFTVRAIDGAGNLSPYSNQVTAQPYQSGLSYKHYTFTGTWNNLPDFNTLSPVATGMMPNIALTPRVQNDNFAFLWEGFITIPSNGTYYFRTNSDDGSRLWLGSRNGTSSPYSYSGTPTVNNDGLHGTQDRTSSALSLQAGVYPIAIAFYEQGGGESMTVSWRTPSSGNSYSAIPNSAFQETPVNNGSAPAAPSGLTATAVSYKAINLSWTDNSNNETGFEIWRSTNAANGFLTIGNASANTTNYIDSNGLEANITYYYQVRAIGQYGESNLVGADNPVQANWKLNNNYTDASGNNRTISASGNPSFSTDRQEGSHSIDLSGSNQFINVTTSAGDYLRGGYTAKTVAFWVRADNTTNNRGIFDFGGSDNGLAMRLNSNSLIAGVASGSTRRNISASYNSTAWNHIALVYSTNTLRLYVNGSQVASNTNLGFSSVGTTTNASRIGDDNGTNALNTSFNAFDGHFDDFYVIGRALSQAEVVKIMNQQALSQNFATTLSLPAVPIAPTNLVAGAISGNKIAVTWNDNSTNEAGFELYRSSNVNTSYILYKTLPANTTSYTDTGLFANSVFYYKVRGVNVGGSSSYSIEDSAKTWNNLPVVTAIEDQSIHYQSTVVLPVSASDVDLGYVSLGASNLPAFASFQQTGSGTGTITFTQPGVQAVFQNITVTATDADGGASSETFNLTVNNNYNPVVNAVSNYTLNENATLSINLVAQDQNPGDVLSWSVIGLPNNYTLTPGANRTATLLLQPDYDAAGIYTVTVKVTDGNGGTGSAQFQVTVNDQDPTRRIYTRVQYAHVMGAPWNNLNGITTNNLKDENNNTTTIGVNFLQPWWLPNNAGPTTGNNSGVYPDNVLNDFWFFGYFGGPETPGLNVTGLDVNKKYNLTFYAGSVFPYANNGATNYTAGGQTVTLNVQNNTQNTVSINGLTPAANGTITVNMSKAPGAEVGYLNALIITELYDGGNVPAKPRELIAQFITGQGVRLDWQDVAYNETGYQVYRAVNESGPFTLIGTTGSNIVTYLDNTISGNTQYFYKLRALNSYGYSDYTDVVSVTTANRVPTITAIPDVLIKNNQNVTVNVIATDDATDQVTLTVAGLPSFASFTDNGNGTGVININPSAGTLGVFSGITVTAIDDNGGSSSIGFTIYVSDAYLTYTYLNFTNETQGPAPKPWNNWITNYPWVGAGITLSNLKDDNDVSTGINVTMTDAWQGVSAAGVRFRDGKELYPEEVSRTGIYQTSTATRRITITGLDNAKRYNFVFFNSQGLSDNALTNFTIGSTTVSLNASYNAEKTVQINGVAPSGGSVTINVAKGSGAAAALLSGLIIQSYTPSAVTVLAPAELRAVNLTMNSISLQWQDRANNETGYEVWRAADGGSYSLLTTLAANTTSYTNSNLPANTTYNYIVRAKTNSSYSDYSNSARGYTYSSLVHVNYNTSALVAASPWNNLNWVYGIGSYWDNLKNQAGVSTNLSLEQPVKIDGVVNLGVNTGNNSGIFPDNVMRENFGMWPGTPTYLKLSGLSIAKSYDITFFCSVTEQYGDQTSYYTINGKTVLLNALNNRSGTVTIYDVKGDENGEALVYFGSYEGTFGLLGAMIVKGYTKSEAAIPIVPGSIMGRGNYAEPYVSNSKSIAPDEEDRLVAVEDDNKPLDEGRALSAFPNPFKETLVLVVPVASEEESAARIRIFDLKGMEVYHKVVSNLRKGTNYVSVESLNKLASSGMYIVNVTYLNSGRSQSIKVLRK